jgi:hypothetical protein
MTPTRQAYLASGFMPWLVAAVAACATGQAGTARAAEWPQQMGPDRNGIVPKVVAGELAQSWPDDKPPVLWRAVGCTCIRRPDGCTA